MKFQKITGPKLNTITLFRSLKISAPQFAPPCEKYVCQDCQDCQYRTKMFHVKHFGTIATPNRKNRRFVAKAAPAMASPHRGLRRTCPVIGGLGVVCRLEQ
jgi:hypothetical protein